MTTKQKKVLISVIIPTFRRREKLIHCLDSVFKNTYKNIEVIVINDCPEEDISELTKKYKIKLVQHKREMYVVYSRDEGAVQAKGSILFFVDDDNILGSDTISQLFSKYITIRKVGLLGPLMYNTDGSPWFYGAKANWINPNPKMVPMKEMKKELIETDVIPNAYLVSNGLFDKVGGENFREFRSHHSELDLVQRLRRLGFTSYIYTKAKTVHDYGAKSGHVSQLRIHDTIKGDIIIERKYAPAARRLLFFLGFIPVHVVYHILIFIPKTDKKKEYYRAYFAGLSEGIRQKI